MTFGPFRLRGRKFANYQGACLAWLMVSNSVVDYPNLIC